MQVVRPYGGSKDRLTIRRRRTGTITQLKCRIVLRQRWHWLSSICVCVCFRLVQDWRKGPDGGIYHSLFTCRRIVWSSMCDGARQQAAVYSPAVASATCFFPFFVLETCVEPRCSSRCSCVSPVIKGLSARLR